MSKYTVAARTAVRAITNNIVKRGGHGPQNGADSIIAGRPYVNGFLFNQKVRAHQFIMKHNFTMYKLHTNAQKLDTNLHTYVHNIHTCIDNRREYLRSQKANFLLQIN